MIKYKISSWNISIEKIEIERETENTIWRKGHNGKIVQERKQGDVFETFEEAKAALLKREIGIAERLRQQLQSQNGKIGTVKGMKEST
mgnify:CR=1 FL=1